MNILNAKIITKINKFDVKLSDFIAAAEKKDIDTASRIYFTEIIPGSKLFKENLNNLKKSVIDADGKKFRRQP